MEIKDIKKELDTQDNLATQDPIFVIYDWEKIPADPDYFDEWEYADTEDGYTSIGDSKNDLIKFAKQYDMSLPDNSDLENMNHSDLFKFLTKEEGYDSLIKLHFVKVRKFVNVFFTKKSAEQFIESNSYHYSEPHIYVNSLWRNEEMQLIRNSIIDEKFV